MKTRHNHTASHSQQRSLHDLAYEAPSTLPGGCHPVIRGESSSTLGCRRGRLPLRRAPGTYRRSKGGHTSSAAAQRRPHVRAHPDGPANGAGILRVLPGAPVVALEECMATEGQENSPKGTVDSSEPSAIQVVREGGTCSSGHGTVNKRPVSRQERRKEDQRTSQPRRRREPDNRTNHVPLGTPQKKERTNAHHVPQQQSGCH